MVSHLTPMITIQQINMQDALYQEERELRNKVLLRPIGLPDHAWEMKDAKAWHFVALQNNKVIGCVVLWPFEGEPHKAQLMQMAVDTSLQGKGIGKLLVNELISFCKKNGIREMVCHARENAFEFYHNLNFEKTGEEFTEVGILHYRMKLAV